MQISIPSCMQFSDYPENLDELVSVRETESDDGHILIYQFTPNVATLEFTIKTHISTDNVISGATYPVRLDYYDGTSSLDFDEASFTVEISEHPGLSNTISINYIETSHCIALQENQTTYEAGPYSWHLYARIYWPYSSITMTVPLPGQAAPGYMENGVFTPLEVNVPKTITETFASYTQKYQVTFDGSSLIYKILPEDSFLSRGGYYYIQGLYLRFENPSAGEYRAAQSPEIEGTLNGLTEVVREHDTVPAHCLSAVFDLENLPPWDTVEPYRLWSDTIYLQDGVSEYNTRAYIRDIKSAPLKHIAYDSLKMTVPLPDGAVPFLQKDGDSAPSPLENGKTYPVDDYFVTYYENGHYSNDAGTLQGDANLLVYELRSGHYFLDHESDSYSFGEFSADKLYLHFTIPEIRNMECHSPVSPKIEAVLQGKFITYYDHNTTEHLTSVSFVAPQEGSMAYSDYIANIDQWNQQHYGWHEVLQLEDGRTFYYTRPYIRSIYSVPHSSYDRVTMTVLLPDAATPGFGTDDSFIPLVDGKTYSMTQDSQPGQSWQLTYHAQYPYKDIDGNGGIAQALIYDLDSAYSKDHPFLQSSDHKTSFEFSGTEMSSNDRLCLLFVDPAYASCYSSAAAPKVDYWIDGKSYTSGGYFEKTAFDTYVDIIAKEPIWSRLTTDGSTNATSLNLSNKCVLPKSWQDDKVYYGNVCNDTGSTLYDVKISYIFDNELNADQLELHLGEAGFPSSATIAYTTRLNGTAQYAELNVSNNILALEEGNAFLTAEITYDTLEHSADYKQLLAARIQNYYDIQDDESITYRKIRSIPVSAHSKWFNGDGHISQIDDWCLFRLINKQFISPTVSTVPTTIKKKDTITVNIQGYGIYKNLQLYLRMPKGYLFTGYELPWGWEDATGYTLTDRIIQNEDGTEDVLYCVSFSDDACYAITSDRHQFHFYVGPDVDTSEFQPNVCIPSAVYATMAEDTFYQFAPEKTMTEETIGLDVNGDGDRKDSFCVFYPAPVTIQSYAQINAEGDISIDGQIGANTDNACHSYSHGNYRYTIYNDLSDSHAENGVFIIRLHKEGEEFQYNTASYKSEYSIMLEGPATLEPENGFLKGSTIEYSENGTDWIDENQVTEYGNISFIKVSTAPGQQLQPRGRAHISLPFSVRFPDNSVPMDGSPAYIFAQADYDYLDTDGTMRSTSVQRLNTLTAESASFSGCVYQDKNWNGTQDTGENADNKTYTLHLYSGEGTDGEPVQTIQTKAYSGQYDFQIWLPGTYTLHLEKDEDESYGASRFFDEHGNYTFTLDNGTAEPVKSGLNIGMLSGLEKPEFVIQPASPDGKDNWYITLPAITLHPQMPEGSVNTIFWRNEEARQTLSANVRPSVDGTGRFLFSAYNKAASDTISLMSDTATLELKVDLEPPTISKSFFYSVTGSSSWDKIGNFLTFGNFFKEALRVTITAEDIGSGPAALYYTLPGEREQTATLNDNGQFQFDIPMDTTGIITYYVEDKAGNKSKVITLQKDSGSSLWTIENKGPVWDEFVLTDTAGNPGVRGADGGIWFAGPVNASARVTDEDSGLALISSSINNGVVEKQELTGTEKLAAFDFSASVEAEGIVSIWAEAEDNAKNTAATQTSFGIDRTAPNIILETEELVDGVPTATVLIQDMGSGIKPDDIHVFRQGKEMIYKITAADSNSYRVTFPLDGLEYLDESATFLVTAKDYTGWSAELAITRYQKQIIYVAANTGSDITGDGSRTNPVMTLDAALERVAPGGMIVLLEDYNGTALVNLEVTLDLNGKVLDSDAPGSAITVGPAGSLTIMDSNGLASAAEGFERDPESEGEVFGGIPGDPAFTLEGGSLYLTDGTIYCGYTGDGAVQILDRARMMYLLTYLNGGARAMPRDFIILRRIQRMP